MARKWYTIEEKRPYTGTLVWFSRPTRKDRTPNIVLYRHSSYPGLAGNWQHPANDSPFAIRPTDQWAKIRFPAAPELKSK